MNLLFDFYSINAFILFAINIICLIVGFLACFSSAWKKPSKLLLSWIFIFLAWLDLNFVFTFAKNFNLSDEFFLLWAARLSWITLAVVFGLAYLLAESISGYGQRRNLIKKVYFAAWCAFAALCFTPLIVRGVDVSGDFTGQLAGLAQSAFLFFCVFSAIALYDVLLEKYFLLADEERLKIQYFVSGPIVLAAFLLIWHAVLPAYFGNDFSYYQEVVLFWEKYSVLIVVFFWAWAVSSLKLANIKIVLARLLSFFIAGTLFALPFFESALWIKYASFIIFIFYCAFAFLLIGDTSNEDRRKQELEDEVRDRLNELMVTKKNLEEAKIALEVRVEARTRELKKLASNLDQQVQTRTKELEKRLAEQERANKLMVGRELVMAELKKENEELKKRFDELPSKPR